MLHLGTVCSRKGQVFSATACAKLIQDLAWNDRVVPIILDASYITSHTPKTDCMHYLLALTCKHIVYIYIECQGVLFVTSTHKHTFLCSRAFSLWNTCHHCEENGCKNLKQLIVGARYIRDHEIKYIDQIFEVWQSFAVCWCFWCSLYWWVAVGHWWFFWNVFFYWYLFLVVHSFALALIVLVGGDWLSYLLGEGGVEGQAF